MVNSKKRGPTETELIAWAIPEIVSGNYFVIDGTNGRELRINERMARIKKMDKELSHREPEPAWQTQATLALRELRERQRNRGKLDRSGGRLAAHGQRRMTRSYSN